MTTHAPGPLSGAYCTVWRWHFFAGLLVLPFLMLLAATGALYLFRDEIDGLVYRDLIRVEARPAAASPDRWVAVAEAGTGGTVANVRVPERADQAARLTVRLPNGERRTAFVDPHDAQLTGVTAYGGVMEAVKQLHSLSRFGETMSVVVEIVAGWAIILVATGLFLWWPRGRGVGVVTIRAKAPGHRSFWRDLHAVTELYAGAVIVSQPAPRVEDNRSLYVDPATGNVRGDIGYGQFGAGAKAVEWGTAVHQGTQYGQINRYLMLGGCIGIWLLGISAVMMWWKRRPKGRLAAPVATPAPRAKAAVLGIVLPLCILYPLTGLSLLVAVALDRAVAAIGGRGGRSLKVLP